jgi:hypothetical protein
MRPRLYAIAKVARERLENLGRGAATGFTVEELIADTSAGCTLNS